jgi:NADH dehydrogenase/NADH:ubiquinone oxidoreductase subunit G
MAEFNVFQFLQNEDIKRTQRLANQRDQERFDVEQRGRLRDDAAAQKSLSSQNLSKHMSAAENMLAVRMQNNPEKSRSEHRRELLADPQYRQLAVSALNNDERLMRKIAEGRKGFNKDYGLPFNLDYVDTKSLKGYEDKETLMTKYGMTAEQADKYNENYLVASFTGKGKDDTFLGDLGGVADLGVGAYNYFTGEKLPMTENKSSDPDDRVERLYESDVEQYLGAGLHNLATQDGTDLGLAGRLQQLHPDMSPAEAVQRAQIQRSGAGLDKALALSEIQKRQNKLKDNRITARAAVAATNAENTREDKKDKVVRIDKSITSMFDPKQTTTAMAYDTYKRVKAHGTPDQKAKARSVLGARVGKALFKSKAFQTNLFEVYDRGFWNEITGSTAEVSIQRGAEVFDQLILSEGYVYLLGPDGEQQNSDPMTLAELPADIASILKQELTNKKTLVDHEELTDEQKTQIQEYRVGRNKR